MSATYVLRNPSVTLVTPFMFSDWHRRFGCSSGPPLLFLTSATSLPFASLHVDEVRRPPDSGRERPNTRTQHLDATDDTHRSGTHKSSLWKTGVAGPEGPATVARKSASPGLCGSPRPPQPAAQTPLPAVAPVLRFPCSVGSVHGLDLGPGRFRCLSHLAPPFSSPHLMWVKFGGHPKKAGAAHDHATPRR